MTSTLIDDVINYIDQANYDTLPPAAIEKAKMFIYDSVGVGISGSRVDYVKQIKQAMQTAGEFIDNGKGQAHIWVSGEKVSSQTAALINGYQIHNQEWDCVHEGAVVHPMATILSSLMAFAQTHQMSGKQLILGVITAVDIATLIGSAVNNPLQFFRPSICGCLGSTAGMCAMMQLDKETIANALGIAYSQISGTMQAHVEGSPMLAMQIGINSRAAITAINLAMAKFVGPKDILEGPFGYFNLFEREYDGSVIRHKLGREYQIEKVSHKPFPTGRAGHGTVDGLQTLMSQHQFSYEQICKVEVKATPLINRLVARPVKQNMDASYAKLCNGYIAATYLLTGSVSVQDFDPENLTDPRRLALAEKVQTSLNDCDDPNALAPLTVEVILNDGRQFKQELPAVLGHPDRPFTRAMQEHKFKLACASASYPMAESQCLKLQQTLDSLEQVADINQLLELMIVKPD